LSALSEACWPSGPVLPSPAPLHEDFRGMKCVSRYNCY
jgi:hypothetical protein